MHSTSIVLVMKGTENASMREYFCPMNAPSRLKSALQFRCPHCHTGDMFVEKRTYALKDLGKMNDTCPHCGTSFKPEPGFYFGAAYVNWGLTVALWVATLVGLNIFDALGWIEFSFIENPRTFLLSGIGLSLVLFPYMFRFSRSMWAHFFIK